jgi:NAD(P)-dependent dehydrogenase (short-subunit alcohol dehydrogenase family)
LGKRDRPGAGDRPGIFDTSTVLVAGAAGGATGRALCHRFAAAGARVVALDADEPALLDIARAAPARIDALALDSLSPVACRKLGAAWADEPLQVLVHAQPLRAPARPAVALAAVEALTVALAAGLRAGQGRVVILASDSAPDASVTAQLLQAALHGLAPALQARRVAAGVAVNAVLLPAGSAAPQGLWEAVSLLAAPGGRAPRGAVLPLPGGGD